VGDLLAEAEALEKAASESRVAFLAETGIRAPVLDVGCGNGYAVAEWRRHGVRAVGVDASLYRMSRWKDERAALPLVVADATSLPFRTGAFGGVYSSGLVEHIGVKEEGGRYRFEELPDKHARRESAVAEMCRVASPAGAVLLDFPNGMFPVDFWHGSTVAAFRVHSVPDRLNPSLRQIRRYARGRRLTVLPLRDRLAFRQVSRKWWGRLLRRPATVFVRILDRVPRRLQPILGVLYPFLVVRIEPGDPED
jgi:SAM-dependent methyltransferase